MKRPDKAGPRRAHTVAELEKKVRELEARDAECSRRIALRTKELEAANAALRKLSLAVEEASDSILITERGGTIEYVNNAVREMSGYSREELIGRNPQIFKSGKHDAAFYKDMWDTVLAGRTYHNIITNRKKNGELFEVYHTITPLKNETGEITHFVATSKDLTKQRNISPGIDCERAFEMRHRNFLSAMIKTQLTVETSVQRRFDEERSKLATNPTAGWHE